MNKKIIIIIMTIILLLLIVNLVFVRNNNLPINNVESIDKNINDINSGEKNSEENMSNKIVVLETTKGNIEIELNKEKAPITVENFLKYVNEKHYDGTVFHRVIKGFMIQGGGFTENGVQKEVQAPIKLESNNGLHNKEGTIAMARTSDPDSATSQFFINTVDNDFLDYAEGSGREGYAVFGKVISGMDVVKEIENVKTSSNNGHQDWPTENVVILKAYVKE